MKIALLLVLACTAASAAAADAPLTILPLATPAPAKPAANSVRRMTSPTISETSVTRAADGTLRIDCKQKANPKLVSEREAAQNGKAGQP